MSGWQACHSRLAGWNASETSVAAEALVAPMMPSPERPSPAVAAATASFFT